MTIALRTKASAPSPCGATSRKSRWRLLSSASAPSVQVRGSRVSARTAVVRGNWGERRDSSGIAATSPNRSTIVVAAIVPGRSRQYRVVRPLVAHWVRLSSRSVSTMPMMTTASPKTPHWVGAMMRASATRVSRVVAWASTCTRYPDPIDSARLPDGRRSSTAAAFAAASVASVSLTGCGLSILGWGCGSRGSRRLRRPLQVAGADPDGVGVRAGTLGAPAHADGGGNPEASIDQDQHGRQRSGAEPRAVQPLIADLAAAQLRAAANAAALPDEMHDAGGRETGDLPAQLSGAVAPVDLFVVHEVAGIESAHFTDRDGREHHAGALDPVHFRARVVMHAGPAQPEHIRHLLADGRKTVVAAGPP